MMPQKRQQPASAELIIPAFALARFESQHNNYDGLQICTIWKETRIDQDRNKNSSGHWKWSGMSCLPWMGTVERHYDGEGEINLETLLQYVDQSDYYKFQIDAIINITENYLKVYVDNHLELKTFSKLKL